MKRKEQMSTPMTDVHMRVNMDGDRRDVVDSNPNKQLSHAHDHGKGDPANHFQDGMNGSIYHGNVTDVAKDVLSSPMLGQRNSSTGKYESERIVEKP